MVRVLGRVYFVPSDQSDSWSFHAESRRYLGGDGTSFIGLTVSQGFSREEPRTVGDASTIHANTVKGQADIEVSPRTRLQRHAERHPSGACAENPALADDAVDRRRLSLLMRGPLLRLATATVLLAVYYRSLLVVPVPASAAAIDPAILQDIDASQSAFSAGRYREALPPTERLTIKLPSQAIYLDRLADGFDTSSETHAGKPLRGKACSARLPRRPKRARCWRRRTRRHGTPRGRSMRMSAACRLNRTIRMRSCTSDAPTTRRSAARTPGAFSSARCIVAPLYSDVHLVLGIRDFADGRVAEARSHFERFLELSPERRNEVAVWLERTGAGRP